MAKTNSLDIIDILLEAHKKGIEKAKDTSIRTGVPLVIEKNGKIIELAPQYKYVRVPIRSKKKQK